jgi:hypothetical protein
MRLRRPSIFLPAQQIERCDATPSLQATRTPALRNFPLNFQIVLQESWRRGRDILKHGRPGVRQIPLMHCVCGSDDGGT